MTGKKFFIWGQTLSPSANVMKSKDCRTPFLLLNLAPLDDEIKHSVLPSERRGVRKHEFHTFYLDFFFCALLILETKKFFMLFFLIFWGTATQLPENSWRIILTYKCQTLALLASSQLSFHLNYPISLYLWFASGPLLS